MGTSEPAGAVGPIGVLCPDFTGMSVVVTGAARGIGRAVAGRFVGWGAQVFMVDLDADELALAASAEGGVALTTDVSVTAEVDGVIADVISAAGRVDVLVNNAGVLRDRRVWKLSDEDWDVVNDVHLGGAFRFTRACVPHFRAQGRGRIINVTSYSGIRGNVGQANYSAAKAGIIGLTRTCAKELADFGVTVNAVSPNAETRMLESVPRDKRNELAAAIPMSYFSEPAEVAGAIAFLASEEGRYVTGVVLPVDGGIAI